MNKISVAVNSEFDSLSLETVEGAEYELDWKSMLAGSKAKIIVELHSHNQEVNRRLFSNFQATHDLRVLKRGQGSIVNTRCLSLYLKEGFVVKSG